MIYLDNAATSYPKPAAVARELRRALTVYPGNPGRSGHTLSLAAAEHVYATRESLRSLLHAEDTTQIIFTQNATYAINLILRARLQAGAHVLISDMEHNAVYRPVRRLAENGEIRYSVFPHKGLTEAVLDGLLCRETAMLIATHVSNVNGVSLPVDLLARFCRAHGIYFVLDASQSLGHRPLDVQKLPCDALCAPGHKGLLGIQGVGVLYLRNGDGIKDVFQGGSGADSLSAAMPTYLPDRLEPGTLSTPAIGALGAAVDWLLRHGVENVAATERLFSQTLQEGLKSLPDLLSYSDGESGIVAFRHTRIPSDRLAAALDTNGVYVRGGLHCAPLAHRTLGTLEGGLVRLSAGAFNTPRQAQKVVKIIGKILDETKE